jgi:hypothetical protein
MSRACCTSHFVLQLELFNFTQAAQLLRDRPNFSVTVQLERTTSIRP